MNKLALIVVGALIMDSVSWTELLAVGSRAVRGKQRLSGEEFIERTSGFGSDAREQAIIDEIRGGNTPSFLRRFVPISLGARGADQKIHRAVAWVSADYLSIGSDENFVRIPMTPRGARKIALGMNCELPTRKLVDEIYRQAAVRLAPKPLRPGANMTTNQYYFHHHNLIEGQLSVDFDRGHLLAGHKKDIVLSTRLYQRDGRLAIYGWHQTNGHPIQPVSLVHDDRYTDYSHGVRLVKNLITVDGKDMTISEVLQDPNLAPLISDEGAYQHLDLYL